LNHHRCGAIRFSTRILPLQFCDDSTINDGINLLLCDHAKYRLLQWGMQTYRNQILRALAIQSLLGQ